MTLEQRLQYCRACNNRRMNPAIGLVCSLTEEKPTFEDQCADFDLDAAEAQRISALEQEAAHEEATEGGFFAMEQKGIQKGAMGGVIMIVISVVWFVLGWQAGYIYYYPPILFCIGVYALVKGLIKGNYSGEG